MSCRRAFDVDVAEFLARSSAPEFSDFREHYPRCPDCAPEMRTFLITSKPSTPKNWIASSRSNTAMVT